jgi:hypothetical protein
MRRISYPKRQGNVKSCLDCRDEAEGNQNQNPALLVQTTKKDRESLPFMTLLATCREW